MGLTGDEGRFLAQLHRNLRHEALAPGEPFYIDLLDEKYGEAFGEDVIEQLARDVAWSEPGSIAFFSGFRGAGKSTQLNRLRDMLAHQGFAVAKFSVEEYLDVRFPITAGQLVLALSAGIWREAQLHGWVADAGEDDPRNPFRRLYGWLREARVEAGDPQVGLPDWSPVQIQAELKRNPSFRRELDDFLAQRPTELSDRANAFVNEVDAEIRTWFEDRGKPWYGLVVILDSLDHARSDTHFHDVRLALRELFDLQLPLVRFERVRTVFCVPPYLHPSAGPVRCIVNIKVTDRQGLGHAGGRSALADLLAERLPPDPPGAFLSRDQVDRLAGMSGGHIRDFLRMVDEVTVRTSSLPVSDAVVDRAIVQVRQSLLPVADDQRHWLRRIHDTHDLRLPAQSAWDGLAELLDRHLVLHYPNDDPWYDVHPLVADHIGDDAPDGDDAP